MIFALDSDCCVYSKKTLTLRSGASLMADIDTISKYLIQHYPDHFAHFALARDDIEVIEVIETEQLTVEARRTDSFIRVRVGDEEALTHHEFQTTDSTHPPMPRRMAGYIGRAIEHHGLVLRSKAHRRSPPATTQRIASPPPPSYWTPDCSEYYIWALFRVWTRHKGVWYGENREKSDTGLDREML